MKYLPIAIGTTLILSGCLKPVEPVTDDETLYQAASSAYDSSKYDQALPQFEQLAADYPWSARLDNAQFYAGMCSYHIGSESSPVDTVKLNEAIHWFEQLDRRSTWNRDAAYFGARAFQTENRPADAIIWYDRYISTYPAGSHVGDAYYYGGRTLQGNKQLTEAIVWYDGYIEKFPTGSHIADARYHRLECVQGSTDTTDIEPID